MTALYDATPPLMLITAYLALLVWAGAAHIAAAISGLRVLSLARDHRPPRPMCLITDATRWLFLHKMSAQGWKSRDFLRLGVFFTVALSVMIVAMTGEAALSASLDKPPSGYMIRDAILTVASGSAIIVLHCGVALHFKKGTSA